MFLPQAFEAKTAQEKLSRVKKKKKKEPAIGLKLV